MRWSRFHPDRLAGRILGMGDVLSLIEKAEKAVDQQEAVEMAEKLRKDEFTLEDFRDQLRQVRKLGSLEQILGMLPNMGPLRGLNQMKVDEKELIHIEAIIDSMTPRGARIAQHPEREPKETDRARQRPAGAGDQSAPEAVPGDPQDDEEPEPGRNPPHDEGNAFPRVKRARGREHCIPSGYVPELLVLIGP